MNYISEMTDRKHLTKPANFPVDARLVAWHGSLDIAGYECPGKKDLLVIKGIIIDTRASIAPAGTLVVQFCTMGVRESKRVIKQRYGIEL